MNILWFDVETTGLDAKKNDVITLAGIIEIDGEIKEEFNFKLRPFNPDAIEQKALEVNGFTREEIMTFPPAQEAKEAFQKILHKYIDPYKRNKTMHDKFIPAGQNVQFDVDFLSETFKKCGDNYFFSMIDYHKLDLVPLVQLLSIKGAIKPKSFRLEEVAKLFDITFKAHDAQADIQTTREIVYKIVNNLEYKGAHV